MKDCSTHFNHCSSSSSYLFFLPDTYVSVLLETKILGTKSYLFLLFFFLGLTAKVIDQTRAMPDVYGAFFDFSCMLKAKVRDPCKNCIIVTGEDLEHKVHVSVCSMSSIVFFPLEPHSIDKVSLLANNSAHEHPSPSKMLLFPSFHTIQFQVVTFSK